MGREDPLRLRACLCIFGIGIRAVARSGSVPQLFVCEALKCLSTHPGSLSGGDHRIELLSLSDHLTRLDVEALSQVTGTACLVLVFDPGRSQLRLNPSGNGGLVGRNSFGV